MNAPMAATIATHTDCMGPIRRVPRMAARPQARPRAMVMRPRSVMVSMAVPQMTTTRVSTAHSEPGIQRMSTPARWSQVEITVAV